jgi:hypothetical protein
MNYIRNARDVAQGMMFFGLLSMLSFWIVSVFIASVTVVQILCVFMFASFMVNMAGWALSYHLQKELGLVASLQRSISTFVQMFHYPTPNNK